jgi:hypothetical protein
MPRIERVVAKRVVEFEPVLQGRRLVNLGIGPSLEPAVLSLDGPPDDRTEQGNFSFPKGWADRPNRYRVHYLAGDDWVGIDLKETEENFHAVQPLPGGKWLLVRRWAGDDRDLNAYVYGPDGRPEATFPAGHGIANVQATERGRVWVSYIDEGVFGHTRLGRAGLACLEGDGRPAFLLCDLPDPVLRGMADCYALNVCSDRETWLYFYTGFPLIRLLDRRVAGSWMMPVHGSSGFAVDGGRVLLGGSYERKKSLFLGDLDGLGFRELRPVDEGGEPVRDFYPFGRRHLLFLNTRKALYLVDLRSLH